MGLMLPLHAVGNYRKYEFPNRKLDVNGLSSHIYY